MRRTPVVALAMLLGLLLAALTACSKADVPNYPADTTLVVDTPNLVKLKKTTHVPDCPQVGSSAVTGGLPSVTLDCLGGGRSVDLAGLRGPLLVNFWYAACAPCRVEMPALAAYARSQSRVRVLGVDYLDLQPAAALQLARRSGVAYPLLADPRGTTTGRGSVPRKLGLPFTMFVDASGKVVHVQAGAYTDVADVAAAARQYLGAAG